MQEVIRNSYRFSTFYMNPPAITIENTRVSGDGRHLIAELSNGAIRILPAEKLTAQPWKGSNNGHHEI